MYGHVVAARDEYLGGTVDTGQARARLGLTPQSLDAALARHALIKSIGVKPQAESLSRPEVVALAKRYAPSWLRKQVLERDAYACRYCKRPVTNATANIDHVKPWPYGMTELSNLVTCCRDCNRDKGRSEHRRWKSKLNRR